MLPDSNRMPFKSEALKGRGWLHIIEVLVNGNEMHSSLWYSVYTLSFALYDHSSVYKGTFVTWGWDPVFRSVVPGISTCFYLTTGRDDPAGSVATGPSAQRELGSLGLRTGRGKLPPQRKGEICEWSSWMISKGNLRIECLEKPRWNGINDESWSRVWEAKEHECEVRQGSLSCALEYYVLGGPFDFSSYCLLL